jgi:methyl-CpG-binding domain protein 4
MQAGKPQNATALLRSAGYAVRLSSAVLNYQLEAPLPFSGGKPPCTVIDDAVPEPLLNIFRSALGPVDAAYWTQHDYAVEPPSPYFSYVVPISDVAELGALGKLITAVADAGTSVVGDEIKKARFAEIWAHNRPHGSGHQLHFDSDDEGRGGIRHPIVSSAFFVQGQIGGPTLVSEQRLGDKELGGCCWLCPPKPNRLIVFDGSVLHGVIPGRGVSPDGSSRRVTLMIALWADLVIRTDPGKGSARTFPTGRLAPLWAKDLASTTVIRSTAAKRKLFQPILVEPFWERVDGENVAAESTYSRL